MIIKRHTLGCDNLFDVRDVERRIGSIPDWYNFEPNDFHYMQFSANILASLHKVGDVFHTFCNARAALLFAFQNTYGSFVKGDNQSGLIFMRSQLLLNSLVLYNILIDLSWQVLWLRFEQEEIELISDKKKYDHSLNDCNFINLQYRLTLAREFKIRDYVKARFESQLWMEIRKKYNYYKHRGSFFIPGLGENRGKLMFSINGQQPKCFNRQEFEFEQWSEKLIEFNNQFLEYFQNIIVFIIPSNYNSPIGAKELIKYCKLLEEAKSRITCNPKILTNNDIYNK